MPDWLDQQRERARLNFLSMDMVSSSTGYCHSVVEMNDGAAHYWCACPTLRQAVDLVAEAAYGPEWVDKFAAFTWATWIMDEHEKGFDGFVDESIKPFVVVKRQRVADENGVISCDTPWTPD